MSAAGLPSQDLPPQGGYEPVQYKRNLPMRGFRPSYYLLGMGLICGYGFYAFGKGVHERRELKREKTWSRIYLTAVLQAEVDRDNYRRHLAAVKREEAIMSQVQGWEAGKSVYNGDRFVQSQYLVIPKEMK
ncbi:hypothetical protein SAICODRAFT_30404 [Saitoella complicata NRRL Y-17804]|nr:uncharacterized protein SAICODRAFT_30404 [Saitoella complicata NRRL Y-17804]ODQ52995.1 hypothetical protein SAICODRAFT_30404 [Saitoella complicata NRRL Y-17804]